VPGTTVFIIDPWSRRPSPRGTSRSSAGRPRTSPARSG
jgi:hypothetical protein